MPRVIIEGGDQLLRKLKKLGRVGLKALPPAVVAGADVLRANAIQNAPGPHIVMSDAIQDTSTGAGAVSLEIGPDKEHWYYKFFETGVQPFEINLIKGRSKRTSTIKKNKAGEWSRKKGGGRKIRSEGQALKFGNQFASVVKRGGMAARPFLRPTLGNSKPVEAAYGAVLWAAVDALSEK